MSSKGKNKSNKKDSIKKPDGYIKYKGSSKKFGFLISSAYLLSLSAVTLGLIGAGYYFYNTQVAYPSELRVKEENTGRFALKTYQNYLNNYSTKGMRDMTKSNYLASESLLQNGNDSRIAFIKSVLSTIKYSPLKANKLNKYGSDYFVPNTGNEVEKGESLVNFGEEVAFTYLDYSKIEFDEKEINDMLAESKVTQESDDYVDRVTDLFSNYISNHIKDLPVKTVNRKVDLEKQGSGYRVTFKEDIYLDQLLFSSKDFHDALDRFSVLALQGKQVESKEFKEWKSKSEEEQLKFTEPYRWERHRFIPWGFVGFYDKLEEADTDIKDYVFPSGNGTTEDAAGLNTPILTSVIVKDDKGNDKKIPVKVSLLKVSYGSDAIKDLMKADIRNRGIDPKSSTKYVYTKWKVENLSSESVRVNSNSALSDKEGNISARTGVMYGLADYAVLEGYQYAELEDWYSSTELTEKYLVWGKDFAKRVPLVWFKALQLSPDKLEIPDYPIQTKDISANKNEEGVDEN